ncbi:MAG: hypothetical protein RM022_001805 [Nostoc sp. EfeVER01]|uniref:hypothetical protein n=1 Tax=unclassified Nostoc TaxID=2593658 RepID=UPI002AD4AD5F|nr:MULTISPECIES: hypothetical protein [unclassified Nostoc]MDZ7947656.1 hypothetical protein [Nostoc sp. EfeVER01]MDZ7994839.1 hypothetical protein [Nostoc sp. EspVER01]
MAELVEKKQLNNIAIWMIPIKETNLPSVLKGVFFMDGNPLPDTCITMYNLEWDIENRTLLLPIFAPLQWTFHDSIAGWILLRSIQWLKVSYKIQFEDETLQQAQITPILLGIPISKSIVSFTMSQDKNSLNGDIWHRKNVWLGGLSRAGEYTLRRVVDKDGCYTPAFNDMLTRVQNECLVIADYRCSSQHC